MNDINRIAGKKTAFLNLGCKVNAYETEAMKQLFEESGAVIIDFSDKADIYVINTCTVTNIADRKSRQMISRAKHNNSDAVIVAAGCYVQAAGEEALYKGADIIIGNNKKKEIVNIVNHFLIEKERSALSTNSVIEDISLDSCYENLKLTSATDKTRAYIKVQDGCSQFCSYCIIPYTRGRIRSRKLSDIEEEVKGLAKKGYKEIVLTGIHLSSYGFENYSKTEQAALKLNDGSTIPLIKLIKILNSIEGIARIRLGSLEPRIITEDFVKELSKLDTICPHFHLSLQSGCDATLKRMNRKYTVKEFKKGCDILRKYFERPAITTDVIVGFPGETEEEFNETVSFLKDIGFSQMHIFKYSIRKGTAAEKMQNQVPENIKAQRSDILIKLEKKMRKNYEKEISGKRSSVLFEEIIYIDGKKYYTGHTKRYEKAAVMTDKELSNKIVDVEFTGKYIIENETNSSQSKQYSGLLEGICAFDEF